MAQNFLACDREQAFLLAPDVRDWLPEGHFAWFVIDAVEQMDLGAFYGAYRHDGHGRAAFEPAMMVALLLYAYARGIRSSRAIERACEDDVGFRVVAAQHVPDHTTIARFRQRHEDALAEVFGEALGLCVDAGLVDAEVIAVDGTKVHADASERATTNYEQLARRVLAEAAAVDADEDERLGDRRGDELPGPVATAQGRKKWLADAKRRLEERRAQEGRSVPASRAARLREAKRRLEEEHECEIEANAAYEAYRARGVDKTGRKFGRPPKPYSPPDSPPGTVNTTDPDSRNVKTPRGWVQGYNAQVVTTKDQIIIAAELTNSSADFGQLGPLVDAARGELLAAGVIEAPRVVLADTGFWHTDQMQQLAADGVQVLVPPDGDRRKGTRPGWTGGLYTFMRRVLQTPAGAALYARRQGMIEPVFGHTKFNRRIDRFQRRGRAACRSEWRLIAATHNLLKLHQHSLSAARA
jgi:transposase